MDIIKQTFYAEITETGNNNLLTKGHCVISIIVSCSQCHDNITNVQTTSVFKLNVHVSI